MTKETVAEIEPVKKFSCPSCSAALSIRGLGRTNTLACQYCGTIIDVGNEDYKIIQEAKKLTSKFVPMKSKWNFLVLVVPADKT